MMSWAVPADRVTALSAAVRRRLLRSSAPTISGAVVDAFVHRVAAGTTGGGRAELLLWLGEICASYGDVAALRGTVLELPEALARTARDLGGAPLPSSWSTTLRKTFGGSSSSRGGRWSASPTNRSTRSTRGSTR